MTNRPIDEILASLAERAKSAPSSASASRVTQQTPCAPDCPRCAGMGLIKFDVPINDDRFGKMFPCPNLPKHNRHVLTPFGLYQDSLDQLRWDDIKPRLVTAIANGSAPLQASMRAIVQMIRKYLERPGLVYIYGPYGVGKSMLIQTAIAEQARASLPAQYVMLADMLEDIKDGFNPTDKRVNAAERIARYQAHSFLAIDELDKIQDTEWVRTTLFRLLHARYEHAIYQTATTLIASNEPPEMLEYALASRIRDGRCLVIQIEAADMRPEMKR